MALDPFNEEVKEMKSVDEETNNDSDASGAKLNQLRDINEITTPVEDDSHEQNEQSFRAKQETNMAAAVAVAASG